MKCPNCNHVFAACNEAGCVIPDIRDLSKMADWPCDISYTSVTKCPSCEVVRDMLPARYFDLERLGIRVADLKLSKP